MTTSYLPVTIIPYHSENSYHVIRLNQKLAKFLNIHQTSELMMNIGKRSILTTIELTEADDHAIYAQTSLFEEFSLPTEPLRLLAQYVQEANTLILGPVIAVMTEITEETTPHFRSIHSFCEELHFVTKERGGLFYVFRSQDFSTQDTHGYYYNDTWIKRSFVPPDVIYNRIHSRNHERSKFFDSMKQQLDELAIPIFNDRFLSKWEIHELLRVEPILQTHIPETELLSIDSLSTLVTKFHSLFIKPIHGSQGRNIFHLFKEKDKLIAKVSTGLPSDDFISFHDSGEFLKWFDKHRRKTTYIIQQGIPLLLYKNRHLDFRVLCHMNSDQTWKVTSIVARISGEMQFVANIARGGTTIKPLTVLTELSDRQTAKRILQRMKVLALDIANTISSKTSGITGELGLDIGLDQEGQLWFIEANSKPSKNLEEQEVKIRPSSRAIIDLCTALSFQHKHKELENTYANLWNHDTPSQE